MDVERAKMLATICKGLFFSCLYAAGALLAIGIGAGLALGMCGAIIKWFIG